MQETDSFLQCQAKVAQSLYDLGYGLQNNQDKDLTIRTFSTLQISLNNYINNERFEYLKRIFDLTEIELKIIAITYINSVEPETMSVFLRANWYENGPTLSLERILFLCQESESNKIDQFNKMIKHSQALAWGLIQVERNHLALIQPVAIASNVFKYLLGEGFSDINNAENLHELDLIENNILGQSYCNKLKRPVNNLNIIKESTSHERLLFLSKLADVNNSVIYKCTINMHVELTPDTLLTELRGIFLYHGKNNVYVYWPNLIDCCKKHSDYLFILKLIMSCNSIKLFFDGSEDSTEEKEDLNNLGQSISQSLNINQEYILNNVAYSELSSSWQELSKLAISLNKCVFQPLSIKEANKLASLYPILPGQIHDIFEELKNINLNENNINLYQYCQNKCLTINSQSLGALAELTEPRYVLDSMVLTENVLEKLSELINRIEYSDQLQNFLPDFLPGLKALFWGKPGTGKSMAAEAIAGELKLPLYKINLANIASKWIGETEKHLAEIFDKAQKQNAVLLFDEADAIFSKRSEIESSHDKNANMGVSYLLQRMETYTGLLLLSTNFKGNLDSAFLRRFHSLIEFPMPDATIRKRLWKKAWPEEIKLDRQIDITLLAELHEFTPSQITNIAERSVLLSITKNEKIINKVSLSKAISSELEKQDENYLASKKLNAWLG